MKKELKDSQKENSTEGKPPIIVMSISAWFKKAGRWIVKHVRVTKKSISVKGDHDIGGG